MNESEFSRSIGEILTKRLTKEKATEQYARDYFDHPNKNEEEIRRAVRLAVFGRLAGMQNQLLSIHEINRMFAYWVLMAGLKSKTSPWTDLKDNALDGMSALFANRPEVFDSIEKAKEGLR